MTDAIIFIVGFFVTILWGSMIGSLLYAANRPIVRPVKDLDSDENNSSI